MDDSSYPDRELKNINHVDFRILYQYYYLQKKTELMESRSVPNYSWTNPSISTTQNVVGYLLPSKEF